MQLILFLDRVQERSQAGVDIAAYVLDHGGYSNIQLYLSQIFL